MKFDIVTIFPQMVETLLGAGVLGRAVARGALDVVVHRLQGETQSTAIRRVGSLLVTSWFRNHKKISMGKSQDDQT